MKFGSEICIYAIPRQNANAISGGPEHIMSISGYPYVKDQPDIKIEISRASASEVFLALNQRADGLEDFNNAIKFSVKISRPMVKHYMAKVRDYYREQGFQNRRLGEGTEGVVFIGRVVTDLRDFVYLVLLLSNVSKFKCFEVHRTAILKFGKASVVDRCSIAWAHRPDLEGVIGLKHIELRSLVDFTLARREEFIGTPSSGYMKALAHQSYLYSGGTRFTLNNLVWCVASIEALLNPKGRSVRAQMEERLRCLFDGKAQSFILDKFKKLYEYRASLMHGSLNLPFYLHYRGNTPFLEIPFEEAEFAFALSAKLLQICFEKSLYDLHFDLRLQS